jgi:hypothetical protein
MMEGSTRVIGIMIEEKVKEEKSLAMATSISEVLKQVRNKIITIKGRLMEKVCIYGPMEKNMMEIGIMGSDKEMGSGMVSIVYNSKELKGIHMLVIGSIIKQKVLGSIHGQMVSHSV